MERKYWFVFCKGDLLLVKTTDGQYTIPYQEEAPTALKEWTNVHTITPFGDDDVRTYTIDRPVTDNPLY